jgi:hypothetical protein
MSGHPATAATRSLSPLRRPGDRRFGVLKLLARSPSFWKADGGIQV